MRRDILEVNQMAAEVNYGKGRARLLRCPNAKGKTCNEAPASAAAN